MSINPYSTPDAYGENFHYNKRARSASYGSGDRETATVSKGVHLYTTDDHHDIGAAKGHLWTHTFRDRRDKLDRIIAPLYQGMLTSVLTQLTVDSGAQFVTDYFMGTNAMMSQILTTATNCSQNTGTTINSLYPINAQGILTSGTQNDYLNIPLYEKKFDFHNPTQYNMHLKIFEFTCRRNTNYSASQLWNSLYNTSNELTATSDAADILAGLPTMVGVTMTTATQATQGITTLGHVPHGRLLHEYWNPTGHVQVSIPPGRNFTYGMAVKRTRFYPYSMTIEGTYMEGWSKCIICILCGEHNVIDAVNLGNFSTSDGALHCRVDAQIAFHGVANVMTRQMIVYDSADLPVPVAGNIMPNIADANQRGINDQTDEPETYQTNVN